MTDSLDRLKAALADRYAVERVLGRGGTATVYLATDLRHDRPVALKVLQPGLASVLGPNRFLREIQISAGLTHPHILPLHDSGEAAGFLYCVMPYVEGESLRERLRKDKQLPLDDALQIAREVADALSYAHAHGVIHRDIKPENILLESGHAVVADFGIGRAIDVAGGERLTETGIAIGTPAYMSPEQASGGRELDGRSDLYSLGCVLYEMLAGVPPFSGPTAESLIRQHLAVEPPTITGMRPSVPGQVAAALTRALAKLPADRFNPVAQFSEAITPAVSPAVSVLAPAGRPRVHEMWRLWLSVVGAVLLIGAVVLLVAHKSEYPRTRVAVLPFQVFGNTALDTSFAAGLHAVLNTELSRVAALQPINWPSLSLYANHEKTHREIAAELAVGTLVLASVQLVQNRLRVNVRLINSLTDEQTWANTYDQVLDDPFVVQSQIALRIAQEVGASLAESEVRAVSAEPTRNRDAYLYYLRAEDYVRRPGYGRADLDIAQQFYEQAIDLDSTFALAYARLSMLHRRMYWYAIDRSPDRLERQREAAEYAISLAPDLPEAHWAMGLVHYSELDFAKALEEATVAVKGMPGSADLVARVGWANRRLGHWDEVFVAYERATLLDPLNPELFEDLGGYTLHFLHRCSEAIDAYNRALALAPDRWNSRLSRALAYLQGFGELDTLRSVLRRNPETISPVWGSRLYWQVQLARWDGDEDTVLALLDSPDTITFESQLHYRPGLLYTGWAEASRGDTSSARHALEGALSQLASVLRERPDDWRVHAARGLALAGLGKREEALREANWLRESPAFQEDAFWRPRLNEERAMILAQAGDVGAALIEIEALLKGPSWISAHTMQIDPVWDPIRDDPRFAALLEKYADQHTN